MKATWMAGDYSEIAKSIEHEADAFIDRLYIRPGERVLDVACGSGNLALAAARRGADVTGIDIASNLIARARERADEEGLSVHFDEGDAEAMPYPDDSFDTVVTMFGAMFAPRPDVTGTELLRVTRPGGRIAMINWTPDGFAGEMFKASGKYMPPPPVPPPVQWGVESIVRERFGGAVSKLDAATRNADIRYDCSPAEVVALFRKYFGPTVVAFETVPGKDHEAMRADLENVWTRFNEASDGTIRVKGEYLEVIAVKK